MNADQALSLLGKYNKWQLQKYLIAALCFGVDFSWMLLYIIFVGDTPNYRCALPPNATLNETIPSRVTEGKLEYEKCSMYVNLSVDNTTVPCQHGYWYDPASGYESTLTTEWDLVCGKEWLVELSMTVSAIGAIIGALIFNKLADIFGRKKVFLGCLWSNATTGMAMAFSPNITFYIVLAGINGIPQQGMIASSYILAVELFATEERTFPGNAIEFFWVLGYMSLVLMAYFVRNWRHLLISLTAPLLLTVSFYWLIPESIPWLVSNNRKQEAEQILKKAAKINNITLPDNIFNDDDDSDMSEMQVLCENKAAGTEHSDGTIYRMSKIRLTDGTQHTADSNSNENRIDSKNNEICPVNTKNMKVKCLLTDHAKVTTNINPDGEVENLSTPKYRFTDLMRSKTIRKYSLAFFPIWFVDSLAYGAINSTVTYLPGDRYLNTFLYAAIELPAYTLTWILSHKIGRRLPLIGFHIVGGLALISTVIQTFDFVYRMKWLIVLLSLTGKLAFTSAFALIYVIVPELFPTNSRNLCLGVCQAFSRSAQILSPHARILYRHLPWLSPFVLGVLSTMMGVLSFFIPETRHTKLPDTIEEIEQWEKPVCCR